MGRILFFFLNLFRKVRGLYLNITGKTESDIHARRITTGKAWEEYCENLKSAGAALMFPGAPRDPAQQAEGVRYLSRLTRAGLEAFVEYADPAFPVLRRMVHETVKMGADNPDNYYFNAQIDGSKYEYRVRGKRNSVHYIGFFTQNGNYGTTGGLAPCGALEGRDLKLAPDGSFEIILSREPRGENWLKIEAGTGLFMVRQTFNDKHMEVAAEVMIENLDGRTAPGPVTPQMIDEGLKTAALFTAGAPMLFAKWARGFQRHTNRLPLFDPAVSNAAGGDASIIYYHSHWKLAPDEMLVITVKPPRCDSWNFQLNNYWMESLDYRYFTICINKSSAITEPDGTVRIVVAHKNPGAANWIDTCGHYEGTMCWRWYRLEEGEAAVEPETKVITNYEL